jgi:hypothetical protein
MAGDGYYQPIPPPFSLFLCRCRIIIVCCQQKRNEETFVDAETCISRDEIDARKYMAMHVKLQIYVKIYLSVLSF